MLIEEDSQRPLQPELASDWGLQITDWQERLNVERLRKYREERIQKQLKQHGIGAILCYSYPAIRYSTGMWVPGWARWVRHHQAIVVKGADPYFYARGAFYFMHKRTAPWLKDRIFPSFWYSRGAFGAEVTAERADEVAAEVKKRMKENGVSGERVGVDIDTPFAIAKALERSGLEVVDGEEAIMDAKAIKCAEEVECMKIAGSIAEACFAEAKTALKPGVRGNDLIGLIMNKAFSMGGECDMVQPICCSGPQTNMPCSCRGYSDRIIRPGDMVYFDLLVSYMGYCTCYYRTFVLGRATREQNELFQECLDLHLKIEKAFRPGVTTKDIAELFPGPEFWGFKEDWEVAGGCVAHGQGLGGYDKPWISRPFSLAHPQKIEAGMTIAFEEHTGKRWQKQGCRLEDVLVVVDGGSRNLYSWPLELMECPI
jgi:Xaa-Pro aminopeptidase